MNKSNNGLDRRDFLKLGLLTTASVLSLNSLKAAEKPSEKPPLKQYVAKKFDHLLGGTLKGISDDQLKAHFKLYEGYIAKINELEARIKNFKVDSPDTINYRGWHMDQTSMLNGAVLHELYFSNLGSTDKEPNGLLKKMINRDFGTVQNFVGHLKAVGKLSHGWSVAALNYRTGKLNVYGLERHNLNVPVMTHPILVLDVYEHAYMIDYGTDRGKYLDAFVANLNWKPVGERLESALAIPFGESVTA
jgi:Fe-Mn family superoxide dismutase